MPGTDQKSVNHSMRLVSTMRRPAAGPDKRHDRRGQSLVEFALILTPLMLILLGIIQFGFIFNSYVTMTNAVREGGRTATIHIYDRSKSKNQNDLSRNEAIRLALTGSMNMLQTSSPNFANGATWTSSGDVFTNGDLVVQYEGLPVSDPRTGQRVTVRATYHQDLIIPLIAGLLPRDANGRLGIVTEVTMVIN
jgi:Flp pilus assembly protein TadG